MQLIDGIRKEAVLSKEASGISRLMRVLSSLNRNKAGLRRFDPITVASLGAAPAFTELEYMGGGLAGNLADREPPSHAERLVSHALNLASFYGMRKTIPRNISLMKGEGALGKGLMGSKLKGTTSFFDTPGAARLGLMGSVATGVGSTPAVTFLSDGFSDVRKTLSGLREMTENSSGIINQVGEGVGTMQSFLDGKTKIFTDSEGNVREMKAPVSLVDVLKDVQGATKSLGDVGTSMGGLKGEFSGINQTMDSIGEDVKGALGGLKNFEQTAGALPTTLSDMQKNFAGMESSVASATQSLDAQGKGLTERLDRYSAPLPLVASALGAGGGALLGGKLADLFSSNKPSQALRRKTIGQMLGAAAGGAGGYFLSQGLQQSQGGNPIDVSTRFL